MAHMFEFAFKLDFPLENVAAHRKTRQNAKMPYVSMT
jgi:hypothetical protein